MSDFVGGKRGFPRIEPGHPLAQAARDVNTFAEEHGLSETLDWLKMNVTSGALAYLAEQRALRSVGVLRGLTTFESLTLTPQERRLQSALIGTFMDGVVTGWYGAILAGRKEAGLDT